MPTLWLRVAVDSGPMLLREYRQHTDEASLQGGEAMPGYMPVDSRTTKDVAEQYLAELVSRGMVHIQFNWSGKIKTCYLHDLMRDLCISMATKEGFLSILNVEQDNVTNDYSSSMAQFQHIFTDCKFIRILKLENLFYVRGNLLESVGGLVQLRFLSLARSYIEGLPQSIGNLVCMEFLELKVPFSCKVTMPNVLWKMRKLRYLHLPDSFAVNEKFYGGRKKLQLDTLKNLQTLKNFSLKNNDVNDIGKLINLRKLTKLPEHKNLPQQLKKLVLFDSQLQEDHMPILEKLHHLVMLILDPNAFVGNEMEWRVAEGAMPHLSQLGIRRCPKLKAVPEGVHAYDSSEYVNDERWQHRDVWRYIPRAKHGISTMVWSRVTIIVDNFFSLANQ
ncbi:hypothetical protein EUGRSUZ_E00685 [Eucalyptus grandis]|uniref:Uncharacterized protein n=2 Tax=Eucalyptus grandis TaxID=71139 RepID=A0ACC3KTD5_EUCGR|nr:hypothetical protein EUGRSUZ_E00685 [Eucalyptus grandis]